LSSDVVDAADGLAVLREVPAGDDVHLLEELGRERGPEDAERRIADGYPVDEEGVLGRGGALEGDAVGVHLRTRRHDRQRLERARRRTLATRRAEGEATDEVLVDADASAARADVDGGRLADDHHLFGLEALGQHLRVDADGGVEAHADAPTTVRPVAVALDPERVIARRQVGDAVRPRAVRHHGLLTLQRRRRQGDDDVGERFLRRSIEDGASECARTLCKGRGTGQQANSGGSDHRQSGNGEQMRSSATQNEGSPKAALLVQEIHRVLPLRANDDQHDESPYT
jgi:hypothetical protein